MPHGIKLANRVHHIQLVGQVIITSAMCLNCLHPNLHYTNMLLWSGAYCILLPAEQAVTHTASHSPHWQFLMWAEMINYSLFGLVEKIRAEFQFECVSSPPESQPVIWSAGPDYHWFCEWQVDQCSQSSRYYKRQMTSLFTYKDESVQLPSVWSICLVWSSWICLRGT